MSSVEFFFDPTQFDIRKPLMSIEEIRKHNAQRYEMEMLHGVLLHDEERGVIGGFYEMKPDLWWTRGHFPDRPMLPGVLALETAGQLCSVYFHRTHPTLRMGLGAIEQVKFRRPMVPPNVLYVGAKMIALRSRFAKFDLQGITEGKICFEATFTGAAI
ncbi:MAG: beta-hydroxyacyl-ACP dehydratase [Planctomycetes bacterium]|nr:beta-hydroxyacyl-ACP dehydratase [Planctomycetota bacterium]